MRFIIVFFALLFLYKNNDEILGNIFKDLVGDFLKSLVKISKKPVFLYFFFMISILFLYYFSSSILYYVLSFVLVTLILSDNSIRKEINGALSRWREISAAVQGYSQDLKTERLFEFFSFETSRISRRLLKTIFFDIFMPIMVYFLFGLPLLICVYMMKVIVQNKLPGYKDINKFFWFFSFLASRAVVMTFALVGDFDRVFAFIQSKIFSEKTTPFKLVYQSFSKVRNQSDYSDQLIYDYLKGELDAMLMVLFRVIVVWLAIMAIHFLVPL